jgi:hypothetical protein
MKHSSARALLTEKIAGSADVDQRLRRIVGRARFAVLATVSPGGPHQSLVAFAISPDLREVVFATPRNTSKYANIIADPRVSILVSGSERAKSVMGAEAVSLEGRAMVVRRGKRRDGMTGLLLAIHPELEAFLAAPTTALVAIAVETGTHVEDFQRVTVR